MNRRAFLSAFSTAAAAIAFDPEKALWTPGKKLISIPASVDLCKYAVASVEFQRAFLRYQAALQRGMDQLQREYRLDLAFVHEYRLDLAFVHEYRLDLAFVQGDRWPTSPAVIAPSHPAARS